VAVVVAQEADGVVSVAEVEVEDSRTNLHKQPQTQHRLQATLNLSYLGPISFASRFPAKSTFQYIIFKITSVIICDLKILRAVIFFRPTVTGA
jgi:hypothetical protein